LLAVSRHISVMKPNLMHCLISVYFVSQLLHVSGIFVTYHQQIYCIYIYIYIYITNDRFCANRQSTKKHNTYQLLYIYIIPPDDGLQVCPKHVEVDCRNKLRINSASCWVSLHRLKNKFVLDSHLKVLSMLWRKCSRNVFYFVLIQFIQHCTSDSVPMKDL
jgi:hypothetical protein